MRRSNRAQDKQERPKRKCTEKIFKTFFVGPTGMALEQQVEKEEDAATTLPDRDVPESSQAANAPASAHTISKRATNISKLREHPTPNTNRTRNVSAANKETGQKVNADEIIKYRNDFTNKRIIAQKLDKEWKMLASGTGIKEKKLIERHENATEEYNQAKKVFRAQIENLRKSQTAVREREEEKKRELKNKIEKRREAYTYALHSRYLSSEFYGQAAEDLKVAELTLVAGKKKVKAMEQALEAAKKSLEFANRNVINARAIIANAEMVQSGNEKEKERIQKLYDQEWYKMEETVNKISQYSKETIDRLEKRITLTKDPSILDIGKKKDAMERALGDLNEFQVTSGEKLNAKETAMMKARKERETAKRALDAKEKQYRKKSGKTTPNLKLRSVRKPIAKNGRRNSKSVRRPRNTARKST